MYMIEQVTIIIINNANTNHITYIYHIDTCAHRAVNVILLSLQMV